MLCEGLRGAAEAGSSAAEEEGSNSTPVPRTLPREDTQTEEREASGLEPLTTEQAKELIEEIEGLRAAGVSREAWKHGWFIGFSVRRPTGAKSSRGAPRGDLNVVDPRDGAKYASVVSIKRKLGLMEAVERVEQAPRRAAVEYEEVALAASGQLDVAGKPRRSRAQVCHGAACTRPSCALTSLRH
eukprot:scaffold16223_cov27-Tisochrysis_lutea.AAC.4